MPKKTLKRMDGFVAFRRIYVDGETKDHGYVYHGACTTVLASSGHCSVLSKCIIGLDSHKKFAIFICIYLQNKSSRMASNCRATLFSSLRQSQCFTDIRIVLYYFVKLNYLGFTNLDKTNTYLKSDNIQDTYQPVKNRPRPKGRHTFIIAVHYNERNNLNATWFAFSKPLCQKTAMMTLDFFDFSFYYPVRNIILKYEYSSSPIYKRYTSFPVGRWLRFFDVLAYRSSVQSILTPRKDYVH